MKNEEIIMEEYYSRKVEYGDERDHWEEKRITKLNRPIEGSKKGQLSMGDVFKK